MLITALRFVPATTAGSGTAATPAQPCPRPHAPPQPPTASHHHPLPPPHLTLPPAPLPLLLLRNTGQSSRALCWQVLASVFMGWAAQLFWGMCECLARGVVQAAALRCVPSRHCFAFQVPATLSFSKGSAEWPCHSLEQHPGSSTQTCATCLFHVCHLSQMELAEILQGCQAL